MKIEHTIEINKVKATLLFEVPLEAFEFLLGPHSDHLEEKSISIEVLEVACRNIQISETVKDMLFQVQSQLQNSLVKTSLELLTDDL